MELKNLPDEIIFDILLRLPIKSLIRCTSVCKPWESRIKGSEFIYTHLNRRIQANNKQGTHLLLYHGWKKPNDKSTIFRYQTEENAKDEVYSLHYDNHDFYENCKLDFQIDLMGGKPYSCYRVVGICNGLICLKSKWPNICKYILWNPYIRKALLLPWPNVTYTSHGEFIETVALGFDALTNDYKVVRLVTPLKKTPFEPTLAEVYSLATGTWIGLGDLGSSFYTMLSQTYVFFNGLIHWFISRQDDSCSFIMTFDLGSEAFGEVMMPKSIRADRLAMYSSLSITGDGKSLVLFSFCLDVKHCVDIWVMKEYGVQESWTRMKRIGPQTGIIRALSFSRSGEVFLIQREDLYKKKDLLVSVDLASGSINKPENCRNKYCHSIHLCEESLVLLDTKTNLL